MIELRVVIDTNIVISAFLRSRSVPWHVLHMVLEHHVLLMSVDTMLELHERLLLPKFHRFVSQETREDFLFALPSLAVNVPVTTTITACRDPEDNKFLELAVDGKADCIITGGKDLLVFILFAGSIFSHRAHFSTVSPRKLGNFVQNAVGK